MSELRKKSLELSKLEQIASSNLETHRTCVENLQFRTQQEFSIHKENVKQDSTQSESSSKISAARGNKRPSGEVRLFITNFHLYILFINIDVCFLCRFMVLISCQVKRLEASEKRNRMFYTRIHLLDVGVPANMVTSISIFLNNFFMYNKEPLQLQMTLKGDSILIVKKIGSRLLLLAKW